MEDQEIISLYWNRKEQAISESNIKYGRYCFSIAHNIVRNREDAEECVNDTWMNAWNAIPPTMPICLNAFLGSITRNLSFNRYRVKTAKKRGQNEIELVLEELEECISKGTTPEDEIDRRELENAINEYLETTPERNRRVFLLRYWYVEPIKNIAIKMGLSESNVKTILNRERSRLKHYLEKEGFQV